MKVIAKQDNGYGQYEYDLQDAVSGEYVGLVLGTETRTGVIWEIQRWRNGQCDGSILRMPATPTAQAIRDAKRFVK